MNGSAAIRSSYIGGVMIAFLLTANTLFPVPFDKALMALIVIGISWFSLNKMKLSGENSILYIFACSACILSAVVNLTVKPIPLFPIVALAFVFLSTHYRTIPDLFFAGLTLHILLGLLFLLVSYGYEDIPFYTTLRAKGLPFIHTPLGFVSTVQVFGTLCVLWLIIYFERISTVGNKGLYRLLYFIVTIALLLTFNRSTYIFYFILLTFKDRRLLFVYIVILIAVVAFLIRSDLGAIFFNTQTLTSRSELLEGFNLSFWKEGSIMTYIFGKGNNFLAPEILNQVKWDYRQDIENGYAMLLHTYGFFGLSIFIVSGLIFVLKLVMEGRLYFAAIMFYYLFVSSFFTQEFVSTTFYIFILVVLIIRKNTEILRYNI